MISLRHVVYEKNTVVISAVELQTSKCSDDVWYHLFQSFWIEVTVIRWKSYISEISRSTQKSSEFYIDIPSSNIVATPIRISEWSNQFNQFERTVLTTTDRDEFIILIRYFDRIDESNSTIFSALFLPTKYDKPSTLRHHQPYAIALVESTSRHLYTSSLQFRVTGRLIEKASFLF